MSKYGNTPTIVENKRFDSTKEAEHFRSLLVQRYAKDPNQRVMNIECQVPFDLHALGGKLVCRYIADFKVTFADGHEEVQDVKGMRLPMYKLKAKWMLAEHGIRIMEV